MHKDCIILAGGLGTRLQDAVPDKPKCLADINGKPFLNYLCKQIKKNHICKVIFSVGYKKEMVKDYILTHRDEFNFAFDFAEEEEPLGTGGAIVNALQYTDTEDVLIVNGDTLFDVNLDDLIAWQQTKMGDVTIALKYMEHADRYGLVHLDENNLVYQFSEKKEGASGFINGGVYSLFRHSFLNINFPKKFSFEKDYLEKYTKEREFIGMLSDGYFIDIGIPSDYEKAKNDFKTLFAEQ